MHHTSTAIKITRDDAKASPYCAQFERNLGIVSAQEQQTLRTSRVAVLGVGGIGAPLLLNLCHSGCRDFVLADFDRVELSNLNRQPYTRGDIGRYKVEAAADKVFALNPDAEITLTKKITAANLGSLLEGVDAVVLSLDGPVGSIMVARECRKKEIPMVEGWATPLVFSRWFTRDSIDYEHCYGLTTHELTIQEIAEDSRVQGRIRRAFMHFFLTIPGIKDHYRHDETAYRRMMAGEIGLRSFAPMVWAESIYLAHDVIFAGLLDRKEKCLAPLVRGFDYARMQEVEYNPLENKGALGG